MQTEKTKLFIKKARAIHGDIYDYSLVDYVRAKVKVKIICNEHGMFEQSPDGHTSGRGCAKCATQKQSEAAAKKAGANFIEKAKKAHGNTYCYDRVDYKRAKLKVAIKCHQHGYFEQTPDDHLRGKGCVKCGHRKTTAPARSLAKSTFVGKALALHGDVYDYSKAEYLSAIIKIDIVCKKHGVFKLEPNKHLSGRGCPSCSSIFDREQAASIYLMAAKNMVKIGISINPEGRLATLLKNQPFSSVLISCYEIESFSAAYKIEQRIHDTLNYKNAKLSGFDGATEWFRIEPKEAKKVIVNTIKNADQIPIRF